MNVFVSACLRTVVQSDAGFALRALLVCSLLIISGAVVAEQNRILVLGGIKTANRDVNEALEPMAAFVRQHISEIGVDDVVVVTATDREHLAQLIRHGRVDWISQTAYNASYFLKNADVSVLSRSWRGGTPTYKSVFFVRKDSALDSLDHLDDHSIAFEHPYSTSAYFVPKIELEARGKNLVRQLDDAMVDATSSDKKDVNYRFSKSEYNTALWVQKGIVDVGVINDSCWRNPNVVPDSLRDDFRIVHETGDVVRALELVRSDLDADIKARLSQLLQSMHDSERTEAVRSAYFDTQRFDAPTQDDIQRLHEFSLYSGFGTSNDGSEDHIISRGDR
ncbi:MAG: phosphate/phosphite/phosphonate ABC transporter substrate-binding protein [Pseudomonadota bacterium]